jgi:hypothetical protein
MNLLTQPIKTFKLTLEGNVDAVTRVNIKVEKLSTKVDTLSHAYVDTKIMNPELITFLQMVLWFACVLEPQLTISTCPLPYYFLFDHFRWILPSASAARILAIDLS